MKKIIAVLVAVFLTLSGCGNASPTSTSEIGSSSTLSISESSNVQEAPVLDTVLSESLTSMMYSGFGGSGNAEYATRWYPYIKNMEVYRGNEEIFAVIEINEMPLDYSLRLILSPKATQSTIDTISPVVLDAATYLNLDDITATIIAEELVKILEKDSNYKLSYSVLFSSGIPVYKYLAEYTDTTESAVKNNLDLCVGENAVVALLLGMEQDFGGSFDAAKGLNMQWTERIAMTANANFQDASLDYTIIYGPEKKTVGKYDAVK